MDMIGNSIRFHLKPIVVMFIAGRFVLGFANVFCIVAATSLIGGKAM